MSAIAGLLQLDSRAPARVEPVRRMLAAQHAYGGDGVDTWDDGPIALGRDILAFTAEDALEAPVWRNADAQTAVVADVRLDNRAELAEALDVPLERRDQLPDSAYILRAHERWGDDLTRHLVGPFAFALWDGRRRALLLARDEGGTRPLVYHHAPRYFAFASMDHGLMTVPDVGCRLNETKVADFLVRNHYDCTTTFHRNVAQLPPGLAMLVKDGQVRTWPVWQPDLGQRLSLGSDAAYEEAFRELLDRVVRAQLRSAWPVGASMSGGLDSSTVAVVAARALAEQGRSLPTFTVVPRPGFSRPETAGRYDDETPYVEAIKAQQPNIELNLFHTGDCRYGQGLDAFFDASGQPFGNTANRIWMEKLLGRAQARHLRVLFSGAYGNLSISYNGSSALSELLCRGQWWTFAREVRMTARWQSRPIHRVLGQAASPLLPDWLARPLGRRADATTTLVHGSPINPAFAHEMDVVDRAIALEHYAVVSPPIDYRQARQYAMRPFDFAGHLGAAWNALFRVEGRDPTADRRVRQFCLVIPREQFFKNGVSRRLVRRGMRGVLPQRVLENQRRGFQASDWFAVMDEAREEIAADLDRLEASPLARRCLDVPRLRRVWQAWPNTAPAGMVGPECSLLDFGLSFGRYLLRFDA